MGVLVRQASPSFEVGEVGHEPSWNGSWPFQEQNRARDRAGLGNAPDERPQTLAST